MKTCDIDTLNQLLRGETSAVETYNQAIEKFEHKTTATELKRMRDDHIRAMKSLSDRVLEFGGEPATGSGAWGTFAGAITGTAKAFGPAIVLEALKKGEEHGVSEYETALANVDVNTECKNLFRSEFLPECRKHIVELERLMSREK